MEPVTFLTREKTLPVLAVLCSTIHSVKNRLMTSEDIAGLIVAKYSLSSRGDICPAEERAISFTLGRPTRCQPLVSWQESIIEYICPNVIYAY